ncbi:replication initiation factor domain-containing protein, partial [Exiguobacterium sp. EHD646]
RFYDKLLEQVSKNKKLNEDVDHWTRVEVQLRKEHANAVALIIAKQERDIGGVVKGILHNYVAFCVKSKVDSNKARWKVSKFWEEFLDGVSKLALSQVAPDLSIQRSEDWIKRQATATLAMLYTAFDGDMTSFMNYLIDGTNKMDDKHLEIINRFRLEHNENLLSKDEYHDILNQNVYNLVAFAKQTKKGPEIG